LRENHQVALYVACGDLNDIAIENNNLIVNVEDTTMLGLLQDGRREIERALSWQGLELGLEIKQKIKEISKVDQDIKKLKEVFGDKLIITD